MADINFNIDFKEIDKFINLTRTKSIGVMKRVMRATLTDQAYVTRHIAQKQEIPNSMNTRGNFNSMLIRATSATRSHAAALAGAIKHKDYDGLANIETSKSEKNKAIPSISTVRGGNVNKKIVSSKRLGALGNIRRIQNAKQLTTMSKEGYTGYFQMMNDSTKLRKAIYRLSGKKKIYKRDIKFIRDTSKQTTKPRKNQWLWRSTQKAMNGTNSYFKKHLDNQFSKIK